MASRELGNGGLKEMQVRISLQQDTTLYMFLSRDLTPTIHENPQVLQFNIRNVDVLFFLHFKRLHKSIHKL